MNSDNFEFVQYYLSSLFLNLFPLPSLYLVKNVINDHIFEAQFPAYTISGLLDLIDEISSKCTQLKTLSRCYTKGQFLIDNPDKLKCDCNCHDDNECMEFFKLLLTEKCVPSTDDVKILVNDLAGTVQYDECNEMRVDEVLDLLKEVRTYCESLPSVAIQKDIDTKTCSCYEYEMSGDCSHDDDFC